MILTETFARRVNSDSTADSICLICYRTIRPKPGVDLETAEQLHFCDPLDLLVVESIENVRGTF